MNVVLTMEGATILVLIQWVVMFVSAIQATHLVSATIIVV